MHMYSAVCGGGEQSWNARLVHFLSIFSPAAWGPLCDVIRSSVLADRPPPPYWKPWKCLHLSLMLSFRTCTGCDTSTCPTRPHPPCPRHLKLNYQTDIKFNGKESSVAVQVSTLSRLFDLPAINQMQILNRMHIRAIFSITKNTHAITVHVFWSKELCPTLDRTGALSAQNWLAQTPLFYWGVSLLVTTKKLLIETDSL